MSLSLASLLRLPRAHFSVSGGDALPSLALVLLAGVAHFPALPALAGPLLVVGLLSRRVPAGRLAVLGRLVLLALCLFVGSQQEGWLAASTLRLAMLAVITLKWAEASSRREFTLVSLVAFVAVALGTLQWGDGGGAMLALSALLLLVFSLSRTTSDSGPLLKPASRRLLTCLPLAAVLFLFFPRIPGPLWDIGLSLGLPLSVSPELSSEGLGVGSRLKPGQAQTDVTPSTPVLVAEFRNWVPALSQLYWRGPVYYDYDGVEWRLDAAYASGDGRGIMRAGGLAPSALKAQITTHSQQVHYRVRLSPHNRLWLYALDLPAGVVSESFIGPDWQLLSHRAVGAETHYELSSWLEWATRPGLDPAQRQRALALPDGSNPRLRAEGAALARLGDPEQIVREALLRLAAGHYRASDRFDPAPDGQVFDHLWFDSRVGNAELYAGAFVFLMRAAGVPARLVTGFRGGKLMALTDFVVVKRSHAHAWVEVADGKTGWRRVDPTDVVAPPQGGEARPRPAVVRTDRPREANPPGQGAGNAELPPAGPAHPAAASPGRTAREPRAETVWPDLSGMLARWVVKLDAQDQLALLPGSAGGHAWLWLSLGGALAAGLVMLGSAALATARDRWRVPAPERAWRRACLLLGKHGLTPLAGECPTELAHRVAQAQPLWALAVGALAQAYADWRYGPPVAGAERRVLSAARLLTNRIMAGEHRP